jgi:hypothetical protein
MAAQGRIRRSDRGEPIGCITISLGVAAYRLGETLEEWIARVDQALAIAVGLVANLGWLGCIAFEIGRFLGRPLEKSTRPSRSAGWLQGVAVLAAIAGALVAMPFVARSTASAPCGRSDLAACVSATEGKITRMILLSPGEPVALESNIAEIEMRGTNGSRKWNLRENPSTSLRVAAGDPSTTDAANVRVALSAGAAGEVVTMTMVVSEGSEEPARFATRFKPARVEPAAEGKVRIVADLPSSAESGLRSPYGDSIGDRRYFLDHVFIFLRRAIGTGLEAREWPMCQERRAQLVAST